MARTISLSDEAFAALRAEKREGESDSDVVLRLRREALSQRKDPEQFLRSDTEFAFDEEALNEFREKMRAADRRTLWEA